MKAVAFILVLVLLPSCTALKHSDVDMLWHHNGCLFQIGGLSIESANEIQRNWTFEGCEVGIEVQHQNGDDVPEKGTRTE